MRKVLSVIVAAAALALGGCCTAIATSGISVEVTDFDGVRVEIALVPAPPPP